MEERGRVIAALLAAGAGSARTLPPPLGRTEVGEVA